MTSTDSIKLKAIRNALVNVKPLLCKACSNTLQPVYDILGRKDTDGTPIADSPDNIFMDTNEDHSQAFDSEMVMKNDEHIASSLVHSHT